MQKIDSISFGNLKVKVSEVDRDMGVPQMILDRIKKFCVENGCYTPASDLAKRHRIPKRFFDSHIVCMKCGVVHEKAAYAIAQNAMGNHVIFTCDCGHKTILPQL